MKRLPAPLAPVLTAAEQRIVDAFREMDRASQQDLQAIADGYVLEFPRRARPGLRLVDGGAT